MFAICDFSTETVEAIKEKEKTVAMSGKTSKDELMVQLIAGSVAGLVQTTASQPFEFWKTVAQLPHKYPSEMLPLGQYFTGCSILNVSVVAKTAVRFGAFHGVTNWMQGTLSEEQVPSNARVILASLFTGTMESLCIVPFEAIKTNMIENAVLGTSIIESGGEISKPKATFHRTKPVTNALKYRDPIPVQGLLNNIKEMYASRGLRSYFQGLMPTLCRQLGNSVVRFSTYTAMKQVWLQKFANNDTLQTYMGVILGTLSSIAVVSLTQPLDVIKTRMQSQWAPKTYTNSINCAYQIFVQEGIPTFWKGFVPRLFKVGISGGITFGIYEYVENLIHLMQKDGYLK